MALPDYKSPAKNQLVDMLVSLKDVDEGEYTFYINGDEHDARNFVHRMRVELSRFRNVIKSRGQVMKPFKILLLEIEENKDEKTKIVLKKSMDGHQVTKDVMEIFDALGGGKALDG